MASPFTWTGTRLARSCHKTKPSACWKSSKGACCERLAYLFVHVWAKQFYVSKGDWALSLLSFRHGDMLFLFPSSAGPSSENMDTAQPHTSSSFPSFPSSSSSSSSLSRSHSAPQIPEDDIDQYLSKQEGKIYRNRDPQLWVGLSFFFYTALQNIYL